MWRLRACILVCLALSPAVRAADPPRLDARNVRVRLVNGKLTGTLVYTLVVGTYYEWNTDPTAVPGLMSELTRRTGIRATVNFSPVSLDEDAVLRNPLLIMTGNRFFHLTGREIANLQRYLAAGGFIYADDCGGADRSFRIMIAKLLPKAKLVELDAKHPIFTAFYKLKGTPKVLDLYRGKAKGYGAYLNGRLAVFYTYDTDVPCGWEKNPDGSYVHLLGKDKHEASYRLGVNIVTYVLSELHRRRVARPATATGPTASTAPATYGRVLAGPLKTYRMKPQMPCNLIRAIAPAGRYVWFAGRRTLPGEQEGLARFDYKTRSWKLFLESEGVLADEINALAASGDHLWIGTSTIRRRWNYGLWRYDPEAKRSRRYTAKDGLVDHDVYDLVADGQDLYAATRSGLARFDGKTAKWSKDPTASRNYLDLALCLAADERYVWAGRSSGLRRYDKQAKTYKTFNATNSPIAGMVNALAIHDGALWISAPPEVLTFKGGRFSRPKDAGPVAALDVLAAAADKDALCLGTRDGGLCVRDRTTGKWRAFSKAQGLATKCVTRVGIDPQSIWCAFGQAPLGVGRYDRKTGGWEFYTYRQGVPCDHLYCLACDGKRLFVGTLANGLWKYLVSEDRWVNLNLAHRAEHEPVRRADVYHMSWVGNRVWLGTSRGLCWCKAGADRYEVVAGLDGPVTAVLPSGERILAGTRRHGLKTFEPGRNAWVSGSAPDALAGLSVTCLARLGQRIYVGTPKGLIALDAGTQRSVGLGKAVVGLDVTALLPGENELLVGTRGGVYRYGVKSQALAAEGLAGHQVLCLFRERGRVLAGTASGLAARRAVGNWVWERALAGQAVSAVAVGPKHMWIGTLGHGLSRAPAAEER